MKYVIEQGNDQTTALHYYKYKEKLVILQSIGIIAIKSKETRVVTYTCKYFSGHLISIIHSDMTEL